MLSDVRAPYSMSGLTVGRILLFFWLEPALLLPNPRPNPPSPPSPPKPPSPPGPPAPLLPPAPPVFRFAAVLEPNALAPNGL